ncbi:metallophosphoesterase [Pontibacter sp. G13]|uniref:metallophosphoesterase n=1 Tax=Pontibacter sp. G13 TaxID=3074898 RepID=UPI0028894DAD|nr:metallophosphoesterase [Pontibacter sp. G13]WNJ15959.1 metallophosphoesterase [Pontibacter sp. G13]
MDKLFQVAVLLCLFGLIDFYAFQGIKAATDSFSPSTQRILHIVYWSFTGLTFLAILGYNFLPIKWLSPGIRTSLMVYIFSNLLAKIILVLFVLLDDIIRFFKWIGSLFTSTDTIPSAVSEPETAPIAQAVESTISRSQFLNQVGVIAATTPVVAISWGIISGAHDYRVRKKTISLKSLPKSFDGIKIAQISDIHSGSFWNRTAVKGGVEMLMNEKPDMVFFTGDLVNNVATEMKDYVDVFGKVAAPLGVFSVLGNHDYGDYVAWPSEGAKQKNLQDLIAIHRAMGWDILIDEHRILEESGEKLAVLGIGNWGAKARFPKYGQLQLAHAGTQDISTKLLLSHDPSHWRAQVLPEYPDIDLMLSGHTHGMQFGVEIGDFKWSPVQYVYDEWADLYQAGEQYLYVNRGFGYLAMPGRIGMPPEITILELKRA